MSRTIRSLILLLVIGFTICGSAFASVSQTQVSLSSYANTAGIYTNGSWSSLGGIGGSNSWAAYSASVLGNSVTVNGTTFNFLPPNQPDVVTAVSGQAINLPQGNYSQLSFLGTTFNAVQPNQVFTITYTDNTTVQFTQSMSGFWNTPMGYPGEVVALQGPYVTLSDGGSYYNTSYLFEYSFTLDKTKTVKSITLPNNQNVIVAAITLVSSPDTPVPLTSVANTGGIYTNGSWSNSGGLWQSWMAYSANLLGSSMIVNGTQFNFMPPNQANVVSGTATNPPVIPLPASQYAALSFLGVAENLQTNQVFTVTYTDGSTTPFTQSMSPYLAPPAQRFAGELTAVESPYLSLSDTLTWDIPAYLYVYTFPLNPAKTVQSLTLPNNPQVMVAAVTMLSSIVTPVSFGTAANAYGMYTDGTSFSTGGLDGVGDAYSATLLGSSLTVPGATFTFLPSNQPNVVRGSSASSLSISLPAGNYTTLNFLGTGMYGNQPNQVFTVYYTDGSSTPFTQSMSDWWTPNNNPGETTAMQLAYLDQAGGSQLYHPVQLYQYSIALNKSKTVQSFSLPVNSNVIVAAVDLSSAIPDIGSVTLSVNNLAISTANYGVMSTPASIAASLAANASTSAPVYVAAVNDALYLTSTAKNSSTDSITYSVTNGSFDSTDFLQASFPYAPIMGTLSGDLSGGSSGGTGSGVTVYSYSVPSGGYSANGNLLGYTDSVMGQWSYSYDSLDRVISGSPASGNPANAGLNLCWSYDAFGNRTAQAAQSTACPSVSSPPFPTAAYNGNNQVTFVQNTAPMGYAYDASGDVTSDNTNTYLYDAEGRICAVRSEPVPGTYSMTGYLYDAEGTRVAKGAITNWSCDPATSGFSTTNDYILGPGGEQMTEMTMNGSGSALVWDHTNVWATGKIIATYSQDNTGSQTEASLLHFYLDDPLGSRRVQTDYAGVVEKTCQSLPFGDGETCLATPTEHLFTGKERDTESGNDYFPARYYASSMGRWMSPDWGPAAMPVPYANLENPQSLNLYSYVLNNPLSHTDPTGHECTVDGEKHGGLWCFAHKFGLVETQHESANDAREAMAPMHGLIFGGKRPQDVAKSTDDKAVNAYFNSLSNYLMGIAAGGQGPANSISMAAIGPGFAGLKNATPVGSALKDDLAHQSAFWMREEASEGGAVFKITGGDGVQRTLIQIPGEVNGVAGRFEYIVDQAGNLTHEMFVEGGGINGVPIKP